jgi:Protein of unknown function (DUF3037)
VSTGRYAFQYAVLRAVPRVDRGEFINIGVIVYCQDLQVLRAAVAIDEVRLRALDPEVDLEAVQTAAYAIPSACLRPVGSARENTGLATLFGMLVAPRSTVVQPSPVHAGLTTDPEQTLVELMSRLVGPNRSVSSETVSVDDQNLIDPNLHRPMLDDLRQRDY